MRWQHTNLAGKGEGGDSGSCSTPKTNDPLQEIDNNKE
jgi:hypothetical protein